MAVNQDIRQLLPEDAYVLDNASYDNSIIGTLTDGRVVYDYDSMIEELMADEGWTMEEAIEWIDYNTIRALDYFPDPKAPVILYKLPE